MATILDMAQYGDARSRDIYHRDTVQSKKAANSSTALQIDNTFYGIKSDNSQFELARISAVEAAANGTTSQVAVKVNKGTGSTLETTDVANFASADVRFKATAVTADFLSGYTAQFTKTVAQDGTTAATGLSLDAGTGNTTTKIIGSSDKLFLKAADTVLSGNLRTDVDTVVGGNVTIEGDQLSWFQKDGSNTKVSATKDTYVFSNSTGSGFRTFTVDGMKVDGTTPLTSGGYKFNNFNATGASEEVLRMNGGQSAGNQLATFTSHVGIYENATTDYALAVTGKTRFSTGDVEILENLTVQKNLTVNGTLTTISTTELTVEDKNIVLGQGAVALADIEGAGLTLGSGDAANSVFWQYNYLHNSFTTDVSQDVAAEMKYTIDWGADTGATGATFSAGGAFFGSSAAALQIGPVGTEDLILNKDSLNFTSDAATINFGTAMTIDKNGLSSTDPNFGLFLGPNKEWRIKMVNYGTGQDAIEFGHDDAATGVTWNCKFSIMQ